jgi:hypothetical protein
MIHMGISAENLTEGEAFLHSYVDLMAARVRE